jgi:hypothetical protein
MSQQSPPDFSPTSLRPVDRHASNASIDIVLTETETKISLLPAGFSIWFAQAIKLQQQKKREGVAQGSVGVESLVAHFSAFFAPFLLASGRSSCIKTDKFMTFATIVTNI